MPVDPELLEILACPNCKTPVTLVKDGHAALGIGYSVISVVFGLAVAYVGVLAGRATAPRC